MAQVAAENLRLKLLPHPASGAGPFVTVSVGCSTMIPAWEVPAVEIVRRADQALYRAKAEGRNRVKLFE